MTDLYRAVAAVLGALCLMLGAQTARADTLVSPAVAGASRDGLFFDVTALNTVTIHRFDARIDLVGGGGVGRPYLIYGRPGSHVGFETSSAGWSLIGSGTTTDGSLQPLLSNAFIVVPAGDSYAFYFTTNGDFAENVRYQNSGASVGSVVAADANLQILTGTAVDAPFTYTPTLVGRDFVGTMTYSPGIVAAAVPTLSEWAMILLALLLVGSAILLVHRRRLESLQN